MNPKLIWTTVAVVGGLLILFLLVPSVVVRDRLGQATSVAVVNDHYSQKLTRFPGGLFMGLPKIEGAIEIRCANGIVTRKGYSNGQMHRFETLADNNACQMESSSGDAAAAIAS